MASVVGLVIALLGGGYVYLTSTLSASGIDVFSTDGEEYQLPTPEEINGPINVLLIGSDTRAGQGSTAYGNSTANLADVIILIHVTADRSNAVAISFPRDLMVPQPECRNPDGGDPYPAKDLVQINATMNSGGPACTLQTIQALTGIKIPYLAMIDFKGVIAMSEVVGGVTVCVSEDISDDKTQLYLEAGEHTLEGQSALAFLRTRYGVGDGSDLSRISNQQVFLSALVRKLKSENVLTNPFQMFRIGTAALENMQLSNSLTNIGVMLGLAREVNDVDLDMITFIKLPVYSMKGAYSGRVGLIEDQGQFLFEKISADEPLILAKANFGQGAVVAEGEDASGESATTEGSQTAVSESEPVETLPEWVQGTKASVKSCSK
ncbi:transcriptional regulator [Aquiluna sp. KACHI24]|nr:transcriptional regulator [Aquiluna sp. KACHI24]